MKNLFEKATPLRQSNKIDEYINDDKKPTKASVQTDSKAMLKLFKVSRYSQND
jgi:hypothetical protein